MVILLKLVVGVVLAYGAVVALAWAFQDRIAFPAPRQYLPDPTQRGLPDARLVAVETSDGVTLRGWYLPPRPAPQATAPGLLWFPGNAETVASLAPLIRELRPPGIGMLILDYRGYGESSGTASEAGLYRDAEAGWAFLASQPGIDRSRIAVYGRSLGTVAALHVATVRQVRVVVLHAPFTSARDLARRHYWYLPRAILRLRLDNLERARRLRAPLLVIHGTADGIVPFAMGRAIAEAGHARELVAVTGAGHNDLHEVAGDQYREKVHAFLGTFLGQ
jgi:dipeptidyl aminopeptidase/acylaminoacyl peptidase